MAHTREKNDRKFWVADTTFFSVLLSRAHTLWPQLTLFVAEQIACGAKIHQTHYYLCLARALKQKCAFFSLSLARFISHSPRAIRRNEKNCINNLIIKKIKKTTNVRCETRWSAWPTKKKCSVNLSGNNKWPNSMVYLNYFRVRIDIGGSRAYELWRRERANTLWSIMCCFFFVGPRCFVK